MKYQLTIMSIDPNEDPDDNHQKYNREVETTSPEEARKVVEKEFKSKNLPVYWIKFN